MERYAHTDRLLAMGERQAGRANPEALQASSGQDAETGLASELVFYDRVLRAIAESDRQSRRNRATGSRRAFSR